MIDKFEKINELLPFYQPLLTERQVEILQLYYYNDFSLTEIAQQLSISRNGVYDTLRKAENALIAYEDKLHLQRDYQFRIIRYQQLLQSTDENIRKIADELISEEENSYE